MRKRFLFLTVLSIDSFLSRAYRNLKIFSTPGQVKKRRIFSNYFEKMPRYGLSKEEAGRKFFILDDKGLITKARYATIGGTMVESGEQCIVVFA